MEVIRRRLLPKRSKTSVSRPSWWTKPREPVTSFGYPGQKRLDVPRCGSIQWIRPDCDLTDWRDTHGSSSLRSKARQSSLLVFRRCRSDPSRRDSGCRTACRIELTWLLYRYARTHSNSYKIAPQNLRWHEHMRTAWQGDLHAFWRRLGNFRHGRAVWRLGCRAALRNRRVAAPTRRPAREEFGKALLHSSPRLNHTPSTGDVVIRRAHKTNVDSQCVCAHSNALIVQREKAVHPQGHTLPPLLQASINFYTSRGSVAIATLPSFRLVFPSVAAHRLIPSVLRRP